MRGEDTNSGVAGASTTLSPQFDPDELAGPEDALRQRVIEAALFGDREAVSLGRYRLLHKLGEGGMGSVYAAYDDRLDRKIALKLIRGSRRGSAEVRERTRREARALARLSHPHVVHVYEVGEVDGQLFVAMEFLAGPTLRTWLEEQVRPWQEILAVFRQAGEGLAAAHAQDVVHRDFKPHNAMFGADGRVRVLDFGLARLGDSGATEKGGAAAPVATPSPALTLTGMTLGTPAYMAPEQHTGGAVDPRTDQFSFCAALFEALYGVRPFAGDSLPALAANVVAGRLTVAPARTEVPPVIEAALRRGLAPDPEARWPTMPALLEALASGDGQAAALAEGRVHRLLTNFVFAVGVALVVGVQVMMERPEDTTGAHLTLGAAGFLAVALVGLALARRRFREPRHRMLAGFGIVMLLASLAIRVVLWQAGAPWSTVLLAESVVYAATIAGAAVCLQAPWVLLAAAIHLAGPVLALALVVAPNWLPLMWLASMPVALYGMRRRLATA